MNLLDEGGFLPSLLAVAPGPMEEALPTEATQCTTTAAHPGSPAHTPSVVSHSLTLQKTRPLVH